MNAPSPSLSVVVVAYDMARELPRTLQSLSVPYQRSIADAEYEVIVVDNGSPEPVDPSALDRVAGHLRYARVDPAPPAPGRAANLEIGRASCRERVLLGV